ncbi:beta-lactamase-like 1 [Fusarium denticulatum]|uniref:Beta-lactamase-like 1 n=1 Tax=Fusarium denticulatum TaxID=48507 RepID=A0A8H5X885_9HYPO|nr:beta-lactamase-like 1 [Fusarium denticulatum]
MSTILAGMWLWTQYDALLTRMRMKGYNHPVPLEKPTFPTDSVSILILTIDTPDEFTNTLHSCLTSQPKEIIVVTITRDLARVKSLASPVLEKAGNVPISILTVPKPGRRTQMALAVREATGDILCFVDDDTVWPSNNVLPYLLAGFENPTVGGVVERQNPDALTPWEVAAIRKLSSNNEKQMLLHASGGGIWCLVGRTMLLRTAAVKSGTFLDDLKNEIFGGGLLQTGEDSFITRWLRRNGWELFHQDAREAEVFTEVKGDSTYVGQLIRWRRNGFQAFINQLFIDPGFRRIYKRDAYFARKLAEEFGRPLITLIHLVGWGLAIMNSPRIAPIMQHVTFILTLGFAAFLHQANAQETPCPLLGAIFPPVQHPLQSSGFSDAIALLNATFNELDRNGTLEGFITTFYVQAFSASDTLFQHGYVPPSMKNSLTSGTLNNDTVFRVGSVSKLLTVYILLAEVGMKHMNDPVTKWVPELALVARKNKGDHTRKVQWDEVTIGQLSGHMSGISRNFGFFDMSSFIESTLQNPELYGPPILSKNERPQCSVSDPSLKPCSRKEFFKGITAQSFFPITSTANTPVYSNVAYQILAYALEGMTRKPFGKSFQSSLLDPLSVKRTGLEAPKSKENAMIPENEQLSWWNITTADGSPSSETRSWMKPITHTADTHMSVGMPWEIRRTYIPVGRSGTRVVDLYTKNGAIGLYTTIIVLSPDHEVGFVALIAGTNRAYMLSYLPDLLGQTLLPAAENTARDTAVTRFAGTFEGPKSRLIVTMSDTLVVRNWTRAGVDVLAMQAALTWPGLDLIPVLRLYPMGLEGNKRVSFRGVFEAHLADESPSEAETNATEASVGPFSGGCLS